MELLPTSAICPPTRTSGPSEHAPSDDPAHRETRAELFAMASHELRTPLHCVIALLDLLARAGLTPEQQRILDAAKTAGRSLLEIVEDVLDLSRLEAGAIRFESGLLAPRDLAATIAAMFSANAAARGIDLRVALHPSLPAVLRGDAGRLRQVLVNLVGNALKFTDTGTVALNLGGTLRSDGDWDLRATVSDTGIGIAPDMLPLIFDVYTVADDPARRGRGGTGLGLAISRRLVRAMHGDLSVESTLGQGSTFTMTVPCPIVCQGVPSV